MSSGLDGGGGEGRGGRGGRQLFLSSHRCPEVDLLPHHDSKTQIPPPRSIVPAERSHAGRSEQTYLSTCCSAGEEGEEGEGSISEWSEEDLSLHFSPSIILQSDDESDPESGFECVDVTVESQVKGPEGAGLKMVPKRLIQLKKKDAVNATEGGADGELSANELLRPRPDLLLRQHSMPAALPPSSSDVDGCSVYRGLVAAAPRGCNGGGDSAPRQRLQKSFSLDETKTKMASCIIKSILSKKMQVEQNSTSCLLPQRVREGGGGRDVRSLVKNTHSPPPSYHQAVGVKGHSDPALVTASRGHVAKVAASLSQSQDRKQSGKFSRPITQQRRGSESKISGGKVDDVSQLEAPRYSYVHTPQRYLQPPPPVPAPQSYLQPPPPVPTPQSYLQPPTPVPTTPELPAAPHLFLPPRATCSPPHLFLPPSG
ncbi:MAP7 domain-containing protein 1 [Perca fluviatilis]|uniref:MAP7 domain-containing protein 1 n=1 Tax=Perca fluviatilis TaxID=8168 RepID=UPI0019647E08|nr:MAP7 domain-containing protein 1 [Perca fluviatilis]